MEKQPQLEPDRLVTLAVLYTRVAIAKGLGYHPNDHFNSDIISTCEITDEVLKKLLEGGIKHNSRPDNMFTLFNTQSSSGNYWNFPLDTGRPTIELRVEFKLSHRERCILLIPKAFSANGVSPADDRPMKKMFALIVSCLNVPPPIVKEIAATTNQYYVTYDELGVAGIRSLQLLFEEFSHSKKTLRDLCNSSLSPFYPRPTIDVTDKLFVLEPYQPVLFEAWQDQLDRLADELKHG